MLRMALCHEDTHIPLVITLDCRQDPTSRRKASRKPTTDQLRTEENIMNPVRDLQNQTARRSGSISLPAASSPKAI